MTFNVYCIRLPVSQCSSILRESQDRVHGGFAPPPAQNLLHMFPRCHLIINNTTDTTDFCQRQLVTDLSCGDATGKLV